MYQYPHEFPNINVAEALDKFGAVKEVKYQHWVDVPEISTGSRVVRMVVEKDIPCFLVIRGIRCKVWYRDQPLMCDICRKGGHKASDCPDKGKCLLCHEPGHVARHCPNQRKKRAGPALSEFPPLVVGATDVAGEAGATGPIDVPPVSFVLSRCCLLVTFSMVFSMLLTLMLVFRSLQQVLMCLIVL